VNLKVLITTNVRHALDGPPVSEGRLSVIEPFVTGMPKVVVINVCDSFSNLRSFYSSIKVEHLRTDLLKHVCCALDRHKFVIQLIFTSEHLYIVQVVSVNSGQADAAVVHLSCEDLVAKEVVSEDTAVAVGTVDALVSGHIHEVSEHGMHAVILFFDII